ncbi:hypothetical protein [Allobranchiibius sp. CTAmp26]|uniref:hypothetical protein n=1 Tax=Allobranchiibius sp. CTAmp26 TaxID=2815214 RepID=UPI001AA144F9|nr:hypothetical protein [Allobranchiibius sp. CTAmp26]MBO1756701.1 hypothetical protein [Allobranchiibius sp. CTAmp26]
MVGIRYERDGRSWPAGTARTTEWIGELTKAGRGIDAGVPSVYAGYATLVLPTGDRDAREAQDGELLSLLADHSPAPWWLGYLHTNSEETERWGDLPTVALYSGWTYTLVEAGPEQAATWRPPDSTRGAVPDLIFPADRSWLVTRLWDDGWRCIGGSIDLVESLLGRFPDAARRVTLGENSTPPGHRST